MIDRIIAWSLGNRALVLALSVIFLVVGSWITVRMPVDVLPDLTAPAPRTAARRVRRMPGDDAGVIRRSRRFLLRLPRHRRS